MKAQKDLNRKRTARVKRTRAKIAGTAECPRLAIFRSNRYISAQLINDTTGRTLAAASSRELAQGAENKKRQEQSGLVGEAIAKKAIAAGIKKAVFDRRSYKYHGNVKALADGARKGGLVI